MKNRKSHVSKEEVRLTRLGENSGAIPTDLIVEILLRLPVLSIARFRCVSKQWASILLRRDFTDLFLKMSSARPCLLFILQLKGEFLFFSTPRPLYPDQNSSPIVVDRYMSIPTEDSSFGISRPVCGWLCSKDENPMICNASTGQYITLPKVASPGPRVHTYLGYDPIDKLLKVLRVSNGYRVLTFGNGELSWRMIECPIPHGPLPNTKWICINGVLYYLALCMGTSKLVCFDVRSEKFTFLDVDMYNPIGKSNLINCNGKLAVLLPDSLNFCTHSTTSLELCVLDDTENQKWSKHIYVLPPLWRDIVGDSIFLYIIGMTGTGEIVFAPKYQPDHYIFFYNVVRNTIVRVEIQLGIVASKIHQIYTYVDYVQDVSLMEALSSS